MVKASAQSTPKIIFQPPRPSFQNTGHPYMYFILGIAVMLFVLAAVAAGYYLSTYERQADESTLTQDLRITPIPVSPTPFTSWKTYTDSQNGFRFEYPGDWQITKVPNTESNLVLRSPGYIPIISGQVVFDGEIYVQLISNPDNVPIKDLFETFNDTSRLWFSNYGYESIPTPFTGVRFPLIEEENTGYKRTEYIFAADKRIITFSYLYTEPSIMNEFYRMAMGIGPVQIVPENLSYTNTEYGFTIILPETWLGYTVTSNTDVSIRQISLTVKSPSPTALPLSSMSIYMFSKEQWAALGKKPKYLAENDMFIFATDSEIPPPDDCVQLDEFQCARRREVPSIIETFSLI